MSVGGSIGRRLIGRALRVTTKGVRLKGMPVGREWASQTRKAWREFGSLDLVVVFVGAVTSVSKPGVRRA